MKDLEHMFLGNGGGSVKTLDDVIKACRAPISEIEVGSITMHERQGNIGETYYFHPQDFWSLNALGLPNPGLHYYRAHLREMAECAHSAGKKLRANIAPFSPRECGEMAHICLQYGADSVVINGSCPNVWDEGRHSAIPALDPAAADALLEATRYFAGMLADVSFKLSPADDRSLVYKLAEVFRKHGVHKLVCCNTQGDRHGTRTDGGQALAFRATESDELRHAGGLAGQGVFAQSVATARTFAKLMPEAEIIGLGGIFNGADAEAYLNAGCIGVQSTTGYLEFGGQLFVDILTYLSDKVL